MLNLVALPETLAGTRTRLVALREDHRLPLRAIAQDERIWWFYPLRGHDPSAFNAWFDESLEEAQRSVTWPFAAYDASGLLIGTIRYEFIVAEHDRLSIGGTWLHPDAWGRGYNADMNHALLGYAFEHFGIRRVEIRVDGRNERNLAAWRSFGATEEGTLRKIYRDDHGLFTDRVVFSVLDHEWWDVRSRLRVRLSR